MGEIKESSNLWGFGHLTMRNFVRQEGKLRIKRSEEME